MKYLKYFEGIRNKYSEMGVDSYYNDFKSSYINPHLENIHKCLNWVNEKITIGNFLDLSCGNGEVSSYLLSKGLNDFEGSDPYFHEIYSEKFNKPCHNLTFQDIVKNLLPKNYNTIICSYALHLCPNDYFNNLLYNLAINCNYFILISPSKYPVINSDYFTLKDKTIINRTHCSIYEKNNNL